MRAAVAAWAVGLVFGVGLLKSGMADPSRVLGFLDLAGAWNPSLALVMAGALVVAGLGHFLFVQGRERSLLGAPMQLPTATRVDGRLLTGGLLFGAGWGLAGFCPGPAVVAVGLGEAKAVVFLLAMLAGMVLHAPRRAALPAVDAPGR